MPKRDTHRVMPHPEGGWQVKRDGDLRASQISDTKAEAVKAGWNIRKNLGTELQVHGKDGVIGSSDSRGRDPYLPKS